MLLSELIMVCCWDDCVVIKDSNSTLFDNLLTSERACQIRDLYGKLPVRCVGVKSNKLLIQVVD